MGGRNPAWTTSKDSEEEREDLSCQRVERTGNQKRSPGRQNSKPGTTCGRATTMTSSGGHALSRPPAGRTGHGSNKEAQTPQTKQHQKGLLLHPKQKGTAESPLRMQEQPQLPYSMTAPRYHRRKCWSSTPHKERSHCRIHFRDNGRLGDSNSHAWLASHSPHTASGQIREATAPVTASGHENGERDLVTVTGHSDHPGGQTAATGHTRAISEGPLAVRKPPPATPKPLERTQSNR